MTVAFHAGRCTALLGPNGSGKTTLFRIAAGLLQATTGYREGLPPRALGYCPQADPLWPDLTAREHLELVAGLHGVAVAEARARATELLTLLDLLPHATKQAATLSGGMRRRLDLAAGLLHSPKVLVLDEPTVGLDIESRAAIWSVLRQLRDGGTTVLLSSHYLEEVDALADHLAIIEAGKVIAEGAPAVLKAALGGDRVTLRVREFSDADEAERVRSLLHDCAGVRQVVVNRAQGYSLNLVIEHDGVVEQLRRQLAAADLPVFALAQSRPSLDDVYLQATGRTLMDAELAVAGSRDPKAERKASM